MHIPLTPAQTQLLIILERASRRKASLAALTCAENDERAARLISLGYATKSPLNGRWALAITPAGKAELVKAA